MRRLWVIMHRWLGLATALFLFIAGVTGAVISWDHELDEWLNSHLFEARSRGAHTPPLELVRRIEAADPRARVTFVPLQFEEGHAAIFFVQPRVDPATGRLFELGYNQLFLDPVTGDELGRRDRGKVALDREHLLPFLYKLHYTLHLSEMRGIDRWGLWLMGTVAVVWLLDCFVAFYLTLPRRRKTASVRGHASLEANARDVHCAPPRSGWWRRWKPAWQVKWNASAYRVNFDIHRAFGLWTWVLLFIVAFTAFSLNLYREVFQPLMSTVTTVTPTPFDQRKPTPRHSPIEPRVAMAQAIQRATQEALRRGWTEPAGGIFYAPRFGLYGARFHEPGGDHGTGGFGVKTLYIDGIDGRVLGERVPGTGTAGDIFLHMQFPLHSGRIAGIPGRILISLMGLVVAALSVTGVVIWLRKRRANDVRRFMSTAPELRGEVKARA